MWFFLAKKTLCLLLFLDIELWLLPLIETISMSMLKWKEKKYIAHSNPFIVKNHEKNLRKSLLIIVWVT